MVTMARMNNRFINCEVSFCTTGSRCAHNKYIALTDKSKEACCPMVRLFLLLTLFEVLLEAIFNNARDQSQRHWFVERKLHGAFTLLVGSKIFFERCNTRRCGIKTDVVLESCE